MGKNVIEYLLPGHPNRVCNLISENIVDYYQTKDSSSKIDIICTLKNNLSIINGTIDCKERTDTAEIVKNNLTLLGYTSDTKFFNSNSIRHINFSDDLIKSEKSPSYCTYGFACNESPDLLPNSYYISQNLSNTLFNHLGIKSGIIQTREKSNAQELITLLQIENYKNKELIKVIYDDLLDECEVKGNLFIDFYEDLSPDSILGNNAPECNSNFNNISPMLISLAGKSHNNLLKLGTLYCRNISKHIVRSNFASKCLVSVCWDIDQQKVMSLDINCFGTNLVKIDWLKSLVLDVFPVKIKLIKKEFNLDEVKWAEVSLNGYYGNPTVEIYPWETLNKLKYFVPL